MEFGILKVMLIHVELWTWLGEKMGGAFESPSEMRSVAALEVEEGLTVVNLFEGLAARYPLLAQKVFRRESRNFFPGLNVIITRQGQLVSPFNIESTRLEDGDKITVLPLYVGG